MKTLFFIFLCFIFLACENEINVSLPYEGDKFVLFSELSPNKIIDIKIDRTYPATGKFDLDNSYLNKTIVELYENNKIVDTLKRTGISNIFSSKNNIKPQVGNSYFFKIKAQGFITAVSKMQTIPKPLEISYIGFSDEKVKSPLNVGTPTKLLIIRFKKLSEQNQYLAINIEGQYNGKVTSSNVIASKVPAEFGDPCFYDLASFLKVYNANCYNKDENEINFYIELIGGTQTPPYGNFKINNLKINIGVTDSFYYDFISNYSPPDGIFKAFQPVNPTITNVNNGFGGVFGKNEYILNFKVN